jgi:hypothetical protein
MNNHDKKTFKNEWREYVNIDLIGPKERSLVILFFFTSELCIYVRDSACCGDVDGV